MEYESLKLIAQEGGGVVGVILVVIIFLKHLGKQAAAFTDTLNHSQADHARQVARMVDDHVALTRDTVGALHKLDGTVRSVERTVRGVEATVADLKTVVTLLNQDRHPAKAEDVESTA